MLLTTAAIAFLTGLVLGRNDYGRPAVGAPSAEIKTWKVYRFPDHRVSISLPSKPEVEERANLGADLRGSIVHAELPATDLEFALHLLAPTGTKPLARSSLQDLKTGILTDYPDAVINEVRTFSTTALQGTEFRLTTGQGEVLRRICFAQGRTFVLSASGNLQKHAESVAYVFNSLQFDETPSPAPNSTIERTVGEIRGTRP